MAPAQLDRAKLLRGACGLLAVAAALGALGCAAGGPARDSGMVEVVLQTEQRAIVVAIDTVHAPISAARFLEHVDKGFYDGGYFFRTVRTNPDNQPNNTIKIQVIQADLSPAHQREAGPPIPLERTSVTGLHHVDGVLSLPRDAPDTATGGFSIVIGSQPSMDFGGMRNPDGQGFAVFGHVVAGMDVVHAIHESPAQGQTLRPRIPILKAYRKVPVAPAR